MNKALDIAGSITGYGDICDAVNAVLYLTEGDYINAGLSVLSIIPGADAFTKTGKASKVLGNGIKKLVKKADKVADDVVEDAAKAIKGLMVQMDLKQ